MAADIASRNVTVHEGGVIKRVVPRLKPVPSGRALLLFIIDGSEKCLGSRSRLDYVLPKSGRN